MSERRWHILFIDDNIFEMVPLVEALESEDYRVTCVRSPLEAKTWLDNGNRPDLILCDLMMMSDADRSLDDARRAGVNFTERYRERVARWGCQILVLTGVLDEGVKDAARRVARVLTKPIDPDDLIAEVNQALPRRPRRPYPPR